MSDCAPKYLKFKNITDHALWLMQTMPEVTLEKMRSVHAAMQTAPAELGGDDPEEDALVTKGSIKLIAECIRLKELEEKS